MKILVVTQYFWPENFRINNLVIDLKKRGHEIEVLTGIPNYPGGSFFPGYGLFEKSGESFHEVPLIRCPLVPRRSGSGVWLALNFLSFAVSASLKAWCCCRKKFDIIFVYEPSPITVALPAILIKKKSAAALLLWVQDLWPESLSATGAVTSGPLLQLVGRLVRYIYSRCDRILVQSRAFVGPIVAAGYPAEHVLYLPNSADDRCATEDVDRSSLDAELPGGFRIVFAGNIGIAQDFETILNAAESLKGHPDINWIIAGDGRMRSWVENQIDERNLNATVHLLGRLPQEEMPGLFAAADVLLVTLGKAPIFALTIPSKVQAYLAAAKPIIAALDGEGARVVAEAGAGLTCPSGDSEQLANAVLSLYNMSETDLALLGQRGRDYYERNFQQELLLERLVSIMNNLVEKTR